ncbi:MAG: LuxR family transcriptional regulator [Burkholderiales bacterium]|nr:LuxR family transcriptional regulator [Burkholderiales bacterium]
MNDSPREDGRCPPILLHDEPPPILRPPERGAIVPGPLAALLAARDAEGRRRAIDDMLAATGCDWLAFGALMPSRDAPRPVSMCTAHADPRWIRHYCAERHYEVDPRLVRAARSSLPAVWTLAQLEAEAADVPPRAPLRRFVADLAGTGMRGGALLVLPGEPDGRRHFVSLLARDPDRRLLSGELIGQVLTIGFCLHEYFTRYSGLPDRAEPGAALTPVQREILGHVARGESDKRIAHHLRISSHAVDYHMRQLRNRFAVHNRVQLAQASRQMLGA